MMNNRLVASLCAYLVYELMYLLDIYYYANTLTRGKQKILFNFINNITWSHHSRLMMSDWQNQNVLFNQSTFSKCQVTLDTQNATVCETIKSGKTSS